MEKVQTPEKKIALYGGSFDPIHKGHIAMALAAAKEFELDEIHFVVAKRSPGKSSSKLSPEERLKLVQKVLDGSQSDAKLLASDLELKRDGELSYSYKTIEEFKNKLPNAKLFWILGLDAFLSLDTWENYEYIKKNISFIVCPRETNDLNKLEQIKSETDSHFLEAEKMDVSSQEIKELASRSQAVQDYVSKPIREDVQELYTR